VQAEWRVLIGEQTGAGLHAHAVAVDADQEIPKLLAGTRR